MKQLFRVLCLPILMSMMILHTSCDEEAYIDIIAETSCSPDLLEFVVPSVTITGENGESQSYELKSSDFHERSELITISGATGAESTTIDNVAEFSKRYVVESINGEITVKYSLKPDYVIEKEKYVFFHAANCSYYTQPKVGPGIHGTPISLKTIAYEVSKEDVKNYLEKLVAVGDNCRFSVRVGQTSK